MALKWRVISQVEQDRLTSQGTFEPIVKVTYETASGSQGSVEIPKRLYTAEYVAQQVDAAATTKIAVENLSAN